MWYLVHLREDMPLSQNSFPNGRMTCSIPKFLLFKYLPLIQLDRRFIIHKCRTCLSDAWAISDTTDLSPRPPYLVPQTWFKVAVSAADSASTETDRSRRLGIGLRRYAQNAWFKVAVSAADSEGTVPHRSRRRGTDSGDTSKTLHRELKKFWKNHNKSYKNVDIKIHVSHVQNKFVLRGNWCVIPRSPNTFSEYVSHVQNHDSDLACFSFK